MSNADARDADLRREQFLRFEIHSRRAVSRLLRVRARAAGSRQFSISTESPRRTVPVEITLA